MSGVPDYMLEETIDFKFTTRQFSTGAPFAFDSGAIEIYEDNSTTQITAAETLSLEFDGVTGLHNLRVVATAANGFESGKSYQAVVSAGTVDSVSVVGEVVQQFSIERNGPLQVWDRALTGGTHNIATSAGRRLRQLETGVVLDSGTADAGGANTIDLETGVAVATDDYYNHTRVIITGGTGIGQERIISDYVGATQQATITPAWVVNPDATSTYDITPGTVHSETQGGGYEGGAVWLSASGSTTAQLYVDGTVDNPIDDGQMVNAKAVADALNLKMFHLVPGASITLAATFNSFEFSGHGGIIALGGQDVDDSHFFNADISGIGTAATEMEFHDCDIGTGSFQKAAFLGCRFNGTHTFTLAGDYNLHDCKSGVAGAGATTFTKTAGQAITAQFRYWSGGVTFSGLQSGDTLTIGGELGTVTLNGADAAVEIRGTYKSLVNNLTGSPTVNVDGAILAADVATSLADTNELQTDWTNGGRLDLLLDAIPTTAMRGTDNAATAASVAALNDISAADILTTALTEAYAADGAAPTLTQALMLIQQSLGDFAIAGTTLTVKKVDGSTTAATFTLDDATSPTSTTRAT